ncbi:hypothetical protein [Methanobrevibacter boviskoreani]|nr:hypothetical protein [Methanobrevibacter boviskoreani]MDD6257047.1 hypothetical protein [Methanobrevibacter boviskoreani]
MSERILPVSFVDSADIDTIDKNNINDSITNINFLFSFSTSS